MAVDVGSAKGYLDLDISGFLSSLRTAQSEADSASKNIATKIGNNISGIGKTLTTAGSTLTKTVTLPIVGIGTAAIKTSSDFESAMSKVSAISGATGSDLEKLNKKAQEMGAQTKFSATESAEAFTYMAMAGWKTEDMLQGIDGIMSLAAADGLDLATTSDIVTDALTAFGLSASDSGHFADVLAKAASNANTNVTLLGESFKYAAPVAGALGYSAEDTAIALGLMANAGIKGSQGGTALRSSLSRLIKPTDDAAACMEEYNLSMTNADGSMKGLGQIMDMLRTNLGDLTEAEQAQVAAMLFGQEAMSGMLSIINASDADYNKLTSAIYDADGAAKQMADTMLDNLSGQLTLLKSALEGLAIQIGEILMPYIKQFVSWLQNLTQKLQELTPEQKEQIVKWAAIAAAIGPVLLVFGKLVTGVGNVITTLGKIPGAITKLTKGFTGIVNATKRVADGFKLAKAGFTALGAQASPLGAALAGITGPMIAIVVAVAAVIAAFVSLWKNNEEFRDKITAIWNQVKATFEKLCTGIVDRLNQLGLDFSSIGEVLKAIWEGFCNFLAPIFEGVFQYIADTFDTIVNVILGIADFFIAVFKGDWEGAWNAVKGIFESIWNGIVAWFQNIGNTLLGVLNVVCGWFGTTWSDTWTSIQTFFVNIWNSIVTWFQTTLTNISTFFTNIWNSVSSFFVGVWNGIVSFVTTTLDSIKNTFTNIWNAITGFLSSAWETIKNVVQVGIMFIVSLLDAAFQLITLPFRFIWENCKETIISIWDAIKTWISNALTAISTTITNVWNAVSSFFTSIWNSISSFVSSIWNTIKTNVTNAANAIKTAITNAFNAVSTFIKNVWNGIKAFLEPIINAIKTFAINAWNSITTGISNAVNSAKTAISNVWNAIKTFVTNTWNGIKSTASSIWNGITSSISSAINSAKNTVSSVINSIKSTISSGFNAASSTVSSVFNSIKSSISSVMNGASSIVSSAISKIKGMFNFSWSLPSLKLPHFSISGSFSLNPPSVPKLSISWYKKAMNGGMILNSPTIFGYDSKSGQFLGGGEAGSETVVGTNSLLDMIRQAVNEAIQPVIAMTYKLATTAVELGYVTHNGFVKQVEMLDKVAAAAQSAGGGDTYNFYSPKAIDEIEAAKQMKRAKRDLAEGF